MSINYIGITQRIPLSILETSLISYLNGTYSTDYVTEQLSIEFEGVNRVKKTRIMVNHIIANNPVKDYLLSNKSFLENALKLKQDRNVILISLLNAAYPFSFNALQILGKLFSAQDYISRDAFVREMSKHYGGNRTTLNAADSVIPMFLEAGFISRPKRSIYAGQDPVQVSTSIAYDIYLESFKTNNSITELQDYQLLDPYFIFVSKE